MKRSMPRWLILVLAGVLSSCAATVGCTPPTPPAPVVPVGAASCDQACANASALPCGLSSALCLRLCRGVAAHNPAYPTCLYGAQTCADENACGGTDSSTPTPTGPGGGRSGP